jgi:hypothetical protein
MQKIIPLIIILLVVTSFFGACKSNAPTPELTNSPTHTPTPTPETTTPPNVAWEKTFGGEGDDIGAYVSQTSDGGYIITGATSPTTIEADRDLWLIKTDGDGNVVWEKTYGGEAEDVGICVLQTPDGGYIVGGITASFGATPDIWLIWLIKTDADGNKVWDKTYGGTRVAIINSMILTPEGGYLISGATGTDFNESSDAFLIKTDSNGNELWSHAYGGDNYDHLWSVRPALDGGYILVGGTDSYGPGDVWLVKTDAAGNEEWNKAFDGKSDDYGFMVQPVEDGGYVLAGVGAPGISKRDFWLIKTDSTGNMLWDKTFGGADDDELTAACQTRDGGYILAGFSPTPANGKDALLVRTDADGNEIWEKTFGGAGDDCPTSAVLQNADGDYVLIGYTNSAGAGGNDIWLVKLSH